MSTRWCIVGPTHPYRGGIPRHTTLMAEAIAARGADLRVITFRRQYPSWLYKGATDRDPDQLPPVGFAPDPRLDSIGPRTWRSTALTIAQAHPDVLIAVWWHPFFAPMYGALLRQVRRRSPKIIQVALCHNVIPHETSRADRVLTRRALTPVDGLVVHAESQRELANSLLGPTPVLVTPHPTYPVDIDARSRRRAPGDPTNLLFFGLIRQYKGVDVLLRALPMVLRERRVRLVVAGEFWEPTRSYTDLVDDLGIGDHVDLRPGYVPDADLMKLLSDADLVVAPYRTATTSAAVEMAFGAGLPVVASRVGGLADQVDHGVNGLLVPPDEPAALASALIEATAPASLDELTQHARADETIRTWDGLVEDVERFVRLLQDDTHPT